MYVFVENNCFTSEEVKKIIFEALYIYKSVFSRLNVMLD